MSSTAGDGDDDFGGDESKKSERKRQRERQRRSDLANAFDELASFLAEIDPDDSDSGPKTRRRRKSEGGSAADIDPADNSGMTRLDLIGRSVEALRRLNGENTELKRVVEQQREGRDDKVGYCCTVRLGGALRRSFRSHASRRFQNKSKY
jgi:hypothetical protein